MSHNGSFLQRGEISKMDHRRHSPRNRKFGKLQLAKLTLEREGHQKMFRPPGECTFNPSIITASAS